jgi:hypothetical protein
MTMMTFGAGDVFASMIQDANGNAVTTPTPIRVAGLQSMDLDFSGDLKEYYGQNRYALFVGLGKVKTSGKFKGAVLNGLAINTLFFGTGVTTGTMKALVADITGTVVPATPFQITPTVPNSGTWVEDLGVTNASGQVMTRVASGPTTGQYSVTAGVYTFAAADVGIKMYISFSYTYTLAAAKRISLQNLQMGGAPLLKLHYLTQYQGKKALVVLETIICPKLGLFSAKNDDFSVPELEFSAQADSSGYNLGDIYLQE